MKLGDIVEYKGEIAVITGYDRDTFQARTATLKHLTGKRDELRILPSRTLLEAETEIARLASLPTPHTGYYGPCDGLGTDGMCSECEGAFKKAAFHAALVEALTNMIKAKPMNDRWCAYCGQLAGNPHGAGCAVGNLVALLADIEKAGAK